jgi:hypothetical protein
MRGMAMGKRPHEKNVIILIEGQSERRAFELALPDLFSRISDDYRIHFPLLYEDNTEKGGDITAKTGITPITIEGCIAKLFIAKILEETKIYTRDIKEIIHIVDLDGAYIPNENILCRINPTIAVKPYYEEAAIRTDNIQSIIDRNNRKRENIEALL